MSVRVHVYEEYIETYENQKCRVLGGQWIHMHRGILRTYTFALSQRSLNKRYDYYWDEKGIYLY